MFLVVKSQTTLGSTENMNELQRWMRFAVLVLVVLSVLGTGFVVSTSTDFSPGVAAAQTDIESQNQTGPTVEIDSTNNTTTKTIVVSKARLPEGGFVAIHGGGYMRGVFHGSEITISQYLTPGTHRNIAIPVNRSIPGGNNVSELNATRANLSAALYRDTNDNQRFDFSASFGSTDEYYEQGQGDPVSDTELVSFEKNAQIVRQRTQTDPASLQFADQQLQQANGSITLTIDNVTLSKGGFIAVHDQRYRPPTNNPLNSTVGISEYLDAGTHQSVTVEVSSGSVTRNQTLLAIPYLDTDDDQTFDYINSGGEVDYAYISRESNATSIINETARIRVPESLQNERTSQTAPVSSTPTNLTRTASTTSGGESDRLVVVTDTPTKSTPEPTTKTTAQDQSGAIGGIIANNGSMLMIGGVIVAILAVAVIWRFERRS